LAHALSSHDSPQPMRHSKAHGLLPVASLTLLIALPSCYRHSSPSEPNDRRIDQTVTLAIGSEDHLSTHLSLSADRVVTDSRCPAGASCVWEGEAVIALTLRSPDGSFPFLLSDHAGPANAGGYQVALISVAPKPTASGPPPVSEYRVTVRIRTAY
jgi:hypothetical protein